MQAYDKGVRSYMKKMPKTEKMHRIIPLLIFTLAVNIGYAFFCSSQAQGGENCPMKCCVSLLQVTSTCPMSINQGNNNCCHYQATPSNPFLVDPVKNSFPLYSTLVLNSAAVSLENDSDKQDVASIYSTHSIPFPPLYILNQAFLC